ncbi:MAG: sensor domain-containing diguanylate cyclase [Abditibacteriales bacterium]|nr:sensor domain-containing diguanylate cyclase [Abditibacteriales bacterium]MDW8365144.1 sensor domain-containing diguanylate cyclase [Abditibacteriales bacterium]
MSLLTAPKTDRAGSAPRVTRHARGITRGASPNGLEEQVQQLTERLRDLERFVRQLSALYEISRIVETKDKPQTIFARVMRVVRKVIPCEGGTLFLRAPEGNTLTPAFSVGRCVDPLDEVTFTLGRGLSAWVAQEKKPILLSRTRPFHVVRLNDKNSPPLVGTSRLRSFASIPLLSEGEVIGVLNLYHSQPEVFDERASYLLRIVASQVAATVERVLVYQQLQKQAVTDSLTGLANHGYFYRRLREEVHRAKRYQSPLSVLLIDVDNFKQMNDRYGHRTGDAVLQALASLLLTQLRDSDVVARYGGEEFGVLLPHTDLEPARVTAERLCETIRQTPIPRRRGCLHVSVSIGVASLPSHAQSPDVLVQKADYALYQAKSAGKDRVCVAEI